MNDLNDYYDAMDKAEALAADIFFARGERIKELEAINADHQETVAQLLADKAKLIRDLTKAQALAEKYIYGPTHAHQQHCVHGVPLKDHWMHHTTKPKEA